MLNTQHMMPHHLAPSHSGYGAVTQCQFRHTRTPGGAVGDAGERASLTKSAQACLECIWDVEFTSWVAVCSPQRKLKIHIAQ